MKRHQVLHLAGLESKTGIGTMVCGYCKKRDIVTTDYRFSSIQMNWPQISYACEHYRAAIADCSR